MNKYYRCNTYKRKEGATPPMCRFIMGSRATVYTTVIQRFLVTLFLETFNLYISLRSMLDFAMLSHFVSCASRPDYMFILSIYI